MPSGVPINAASTKPATTRYNVMPRSSVNVPDATSSRSASQVLPMPGKMNAGTRCAASHHKTSNTATRDNRCSTTRTKPFIRADRAGIAEETAGTDDIVLSLDKGAHVAHGFSHVGRKRIPRTREIDSEHIAHASRARPQHDDAVGQYDRFFDVVRDEHHRHLQLFAHTQKLC